MRVYPLGDALYLFLNKHVVMIEFGLVHLIHLVSEVNDALPRFIEFQRLID